MRVVWTDPDGGEQYEGKLLDFDPESDSEVFFLLKDDGGEAEVFLHEVTFLDPIG